MGIIALAAAVDIIGLCILIVVALVILVSHRRS